MKKSGSRPPSTGSRKKPPDDDSGSGIPSVIQDQRGADSYLVRVRYRSGSELADIHFRLSDGKFYPIVQEWRYIVANRRRITNESRMKLCDDIFQRMLPVLVPDWSELTIGQKSDVEAALKLRLKALAKSRVAEVEIPYENEAIGWAARLFPWEQVLGLLTRPYRSESEPLTVLRYLHRASGDVRGAVSRSPLLAVCSGPGELGQMFDLHGECRMVAAALCPNVDERSVILRDPDVESLMTRMQSQPPAVVHFAGVDSNSLKTLGFQDEANLEYDGFVLKGNSSPYRSLFAEELGKILSSGRRKPTLVAISACSSAGRLAAMAVAGGVRFAIGFQDTISDADALLFFTAFYQSWAHGADVLSAFVEARKQLSTQVSVLAGTGAVLWSAVPLLTPTGMKGKTRAASKRSVSKDVVTLDILPLKSLNYSLLHNHRSPFEKFLVLKDSHDDLPPLHVEVALSVGHETCRCQFTERLPQQPQPLTLAEKIRLPLIASVLRQCSESMRTNLYIKVSCGDRLLCERSDRITVLPADEWRDDGQDHCWLPSFVLPRDPAVLQIIIAAQRYLRTLTDDCSAGFDGYQRLAAENPDAAAVVDPQVQAIWAAIQHDCSLAYINPPPSYSSQSQRLRTPTQILNGKAATCIDLALLFASCLEYIGVYPVIFLIAGHAFPGYWRSDRAWWQMREFQGRGAIVGQDDAVSAARTAATGAQMPGGAKWMFEGVDNLTELLSYVQSGELVPFESTFVALLKGFGDALDTAPANLHPQTFDAMVDVQVARGADVTPLPIV